MATLIEFLRPGEELVVTRLDRLGRDTRAVLNPIHEAERRGASVTVLVPHLSTRGVMGPAVPTVLGMVAQMERRLIEGRQREGIARAEAAGACTGGKARLDHGGIRRTASDGHGPPAVAKAPSCSRMRVHSVLRTGSADDNQESTRARSATCRSMKRLAIGRRNPSDKANS